jgi:hypothetical protein
MNRKTVRAFVKARLLAFMTIASLLAAFGTATALMRGQSDWPSRYAHTSSVLSAITHPRLSQQPNANQNASAVGFTSGNLVVLRIGDGTASLSSAAAAVFLEERATNGSLVQTIPISTAASGSNAALTVAGSAAADGHLNRSADGR